MRPPPQQPLALFAVDMTNIQPGNLFYSPSIARRRPREFPSRPGIPGTLDTPPWGTKTRLLGCDESDRAYSCQADLQRVHTLKREGRPGCRTYSGVRDQFRKWPRRSSREAVEVCPRSRAVPL